jgi:hypothetical protein
MANETQIDLFGFNRWKKYGNEKTNSYEEFKDKFKPKLTTDDCYTPQAVMDVVNDFVRNDLGAGDRPFVRPFMPGGDFENFEYPENCVVVDNPPFSIFSKINRWYIERGIDFFLFGPHLTLFNSYDATFVVCGVDVIYANGANVCTSFTTSLCPDCRVWVANGLRERIEKAQNIGKLQVRNIQYPDEVITSARLSSVLRNGAGDFVIGKNECYYARRLDCGQGLFGGGFIISREAVARKSSAIRKAEKASAIRKAEKEINKIQSYYSLSERERALVDSLSAKS